MINISIYKWIEIEGLPKKAAYVIKKNLSCANDTFYMLLRRNGKPPWGIEKEHTFYKEDGNILKIPRSQEDRLLNYLDKIGLEYKVWRRTISKSGDFKENWIILRQNQIDIVNAALKEKSGLIVAGTGTGKTIMALDIIYKLGKTATILVPKNTIGAQFIEECQRYLKIKPGVINGKEKTIGNITIATFQSLTNNKDLLHQLAENTSTLIVDEAQGSVSPRNMEVVTSFQAEHIYGLTASPERDDSRAPGVYHIFGNPIIEHHETNHDPIVEVYQTRAAIDPSYDYHQMIDDMVDNEQRNKLITSIVACSIAEKRRVLVLTKRIAHYEKFKKIFSGPRAFFIDSNNKERDTLLMKMKRNKVDYSVIFGTTSLLSVGVDIPSLDTLVIACDMKGKVLTTQSAGRVLRAFDGKKQPIIVDFHDGYVSGPGRESHCYNPILHNQFKERNSLYKHKGWEVQYKGGWEPKSYSD